MGWIWVLTMRTRDEKSHVFHAREACGSRRACCDTWGRHMYVVSLGVDIRECPPKSAILGV